MPPPRPLRAPGPWIAAASLLLALAAWWWARTAGAAVIEADVRGERARWLVERVMGLPPTFAHERRATQWRTFVDALLIAVGPLVAFARALRRPPGPEGSAQVRGWRYLVLVGLGAAFLALTVFRGATQDYFLYGQIWYEVRQGHDPWFLVLGNDGMYSLNAYGPLFNLFAPLTWANPLAPKLLFASAYLAFVAWIFRRRFPAALPGPAATLGLMLWAWTPYAWVEVPFYGHFDILVGLACLAAVEARVRGRDSLCGLFLGLGILLKYMPLFLVPFLALDRGRLRARPILVAGAVVALGLAASVAYWGPTTFRPLALASTRSSTWLSIWRFLKGPFSPLHGWTDFVRYSDSLAKVVLLLALARAWSWCRRHRPGPRASAVLAILVTLLLYPVGFPQYQMVLAVLAADWLLADFAALRHRGPLVAASVAYFGWLAAFNVYEGRYSISGNRIEEWVGVPTFLLGSSLVAALLGSSRVPPEPSTGGDPDGAGPVSRPGP